MKHIIVLGDGMADHPVERLGGKTLLQHAKTPYMDLLARMGRNGRLLTVPEGFQPGSEVANATILGYDMRKCYEGRGPLEAASIGYDMAPDELALRCNLITIEDGKIKNHHGGHLKTEEGKVLIEFLNEHLGNDKVKFIPGIQYRHLLIIKGGKKGFECAPPHDHPGEEWEGLLPKGENETVELIINLVKQSQELLAKHPLNEQRKAEGKVPANSIWPWGGGYRPRMSTLSETFSQIKQGAVISAVDLIKGIGRYAGLESISVDGATGLYNTNYEGKAKAAIEALRNDDFVFLHVEASDEAGHDGDLELKLHTIEYLDSRIIGPIYEEVKTWDEPVCISVLPDHPTPVEIRTHIAEPVPFLIWHRDMEPDEVQQFDEISAVSGSYGLLKESEFIRCFMKES